MLVDWCCLCSSDKMKQYCAVFSYTQGPSLLPRSQMGQIWCRLPAFPSKQTEPTATDDPQAKLNYQSKSGLSSSPNCLSKRHMLYLKPVSCFCSLSIRFGIGCEFCGWLAPDSLYPPLLLTVTIVCTHTVGGSSINLYSFLFSCVGNTLV